MTTVDGRSALAAILAALDEDVPPDQETDEFTCADLAAERGITYNKMAFRLRRLVEAGELTSRLVRTPGGRNALAYRQVVSESPGDNLPGA